MLKCGAAEVDITPELGIQIFGDVGRPRPAEVIADPLYSRALVLESATRRLCFLSLDLGAISEPHVAEIRRRAQALGFQPSAVMIHATQTHSAPMLGHSICEGQTPHLHGGEHWICADERYHAFAIERIMHSIAEASAKVSAAKIGAASDVDPRVAFNRRFVMRDGTVKCNPGGAARLNILHAEGPADPEVGVLAIQSGGATRALLLHHTCHPTHGYPTRTISADWPGAWVAAMKSRLGAACVPLVANGCCGNILHTNWADAQFVNDQLRMGQMLGETAAAAFARIEYRDDVILEARTRTLRLPYREMTRNEITKAQQLVRDFPHGKRLKHDPSCIEWDWVYAIGILDLAERKERSATREYELQVFRIGDIALVALPGEPFVEAQLEVKRRSPVRHTYLAHNSNGYAGYLPTKHAFKGGGYETWTATWSQFAPEALDIVTEETAKLLREVF